MQKPMHWSHRWQRQPIVDKPWSILLFRFIITFKTIKSFSFSYSEYPSRFTLPLVNDTCQNMATTITSWCDCCRRRRHYRWPTLYFWRDWDLNWRRFGVWFLIITILISNVTVNCEIQSWRPNCHLTQRSRICSIIVANSSWFSRRRLMSETEENFELETFLEMGFLLDWGCCSETFSNLCEMGFLKMVRVGKFSFAGRTLGADLGVLEGRCFTLLGLWLLLVLFVEVLVEEEEVRERKSLRQQMGASMEDIEEAWLQLSRPPPLLTS